MNTFQCYMIDPANVQIVRGVIALFHPNKAKIKIKVGIRYDWIEISGHGIAIGIDFKHGLQGSGWSIKAFEKAFKEGSFEAWRFIDDSKGRDINDYKFINIELNNLFIKTDVPKPTAKEMFDYYYKD